jgi:hypothetical protein
LEPSVGAAVGGEVAEVVLEAEVVVDVVRVVEVANVVL